MYLHVLEYTADLQFQLHCRWVVTVLKHNKLPF